MRLTASYITLRSIETEDLEKMRSWRNDPAVNIFMEYRENIDFESHVEWFRRLDALADLYLLVEVDKKSVGIVNLKNIDMRSGTAEAGIFIGDADTRNTTAPVLATVLLMYLGFGIIGLNTVSANVSTNNAPALEMNRALGYGHRIAASPGFDLYTCSGADFIKSPLVIKSLRMLKEITVYAEGDQRITAKKPPLVNDLCKLQLVL